MRWTEDWAIWVPVKSKPPWELSSPAGAFFFTPANQPKLQKTNFMFSISCAFGIYLSRRVTSSHSASGTSAWRLRTCVSLITWRFMTVLTLGLDECWGGETFGLKYSKSLCLRIKWRSRKYEWKCEIDNYNMIKQLLLTLLQVLWYRPPSWPDLLRPPHDCGVCGWRRSGRQRL